MSGWKRASGLNRQGGGGLEMLQLTERCQPEKKSSCTEPRERVLTYVGKKRPRNEFIFGEWKLKS